MEASAVFTEALRTLGTIELATAVLRYRRSTVVRGLAALPPVVKRELRQRCARERWSWIEFACVPLTEKIKHINKHLNQ